MGTIVRSNAAPEFVRPANGPAFSLPELQKIVAGYIEAVYLRMSGERVIMFVNEDGRRLELPVNGYATFLVRQFADPPHAPDVVIVGDAIVCDLLEAGADPRGPLA